MTSLSLHPLSYPRRRLEPKLTAAGLYVVAFLRDRGDRKEDSEDTIEGIVIPLHSETGLVARSLPFMTYAIHL